MNDTDERDRPEGSFRELMESDEFNNNSNELLFAVGNDESGKLIVADITTLHHLLIAGPAGTDKDVLLCSIILSLLYKYKPEECKLVLIDSFKGFNDITHLLFPVITDPLFAVSTLRLLADEVDNRYGLFVTKGVRRIKEYNDLINRDEDTGKILPYIVIIIDELEELMIKYKQDTEDLICRITQKGRSAGIHLIAATKRPSIDIITGLIKANMPSRIAFSVSNKTESYIILDEPGAEELKRREKMLFWPVYAKEPLRLQVCNLDFYDIYDVRAMFGLEEDWLYKEAVETVIKEKKCSVKMIQRKFWLGYRRAASLIHMMEKRGIVGPADDNGQRKINEIESQVKDI